MPAYPIIISAVDKATEQIERIKRSVSDVTAPVDRVQKSFARLADATGLTKLAKGFSTVAAASLNVFRNVSRIVAPLGAITGALSVAGMAKLVDSWSQFGQKLEFTAQRVGMTAEQLQGFEGAARLAGGSAGGLDSALKTLGDNMTDAIGGRNPEALMYLNTLGLSFRATATSARSAADVLPEIADKIAAIKNPALQARVATELLGGSAEELLPFLRGGSAGIQEYVQQAEKYGVMNDQAAQSAIALRKAQSGLELAVLGLTNSIAVQLAPILGPLLNQLADWIAKNREWIATGIGNAVKQFGDWIKSIDWAGVGAGIVSFVKGANSAAQAVGGWKTAAEILFGLWVGAKFAGMLANIAKMGLAIDLALGPIGWAVGALGLLGIAMAKVSEYEGKNPDFAKRFQHPKAGGAAGMAAPVEPYYNAKTPEGRAQHQAWLASHPAAPEMPETPDQAAGPAVTVPGGADQAVAPAAVAPRAAGLPENLAAPGLAGEPRGLRNNNPLNLMYAGQPGAVGEDGGGYGVYATMQDGIAAATRQLVKYQQVNGLSTIAQMVARWAPPGSNDTASYIADVSARTGIAPNESVNMKDPAIAQAIVGAMAHHELGVGVDPAVLAQGLSAALKVPVGVAAQGVKAAGSPAGLSSAQGAPGAVGAPAAMGAPAQLNTPEAGAPGTPGAVGANGSLDVTIKHVNPPAGASVSAVAKGDGVNGTPKIETSFPDFAAA